MWLLEKEHLKESRPIMTVLEKEDFDSWLSAKYPAPVAAL